MTPRHDVELDCRGMKCPLPVIYVHRQLKELGQEQVLKVVATDPDFLDDVRWAMRETGGTVLSLMESEQVIGEYIAFVTRT